MTEYSGDSEKDGAFGVQPIKNLRNVLPAEEVSEGMQISYEEFEKVDIRVGKIIEVRDFPEAKKPAFKLKIDFGSEIGIKASSVQAPGAHAKEDLEGMLVCCVVNFPPKSIAGFQSEVLTLGFKNVAGTGWVLITPAKDTVEIGSKLA